MNRLRYVAALCCALSFVLKAQGPESRAAAWREQAAFRPFGGGVRRVLLSPDARSVLTLGEDGRLALGDAGAAPRTVWAGDVHARDRLAFSADGRLAGWAPAVPTNDDLAVFDVATGRRIEGWKATRLDPPDGRESEGGERRGARLHVSPEGFVAFVADERSPDFALGTPGAPLRGPRDSGSPWSTSSDGRTLGYVSATGSDHEGVRKREATFRLFDVATRREIASARYADETTSADPHLREGAAIDVDGPRFGTIRNGVFRVFDFADPRRVVATLGSGVVCVMARGGDWLFGTREGRVERWRDGRPIADLASGLAPERFTVDHRDGGDAVLWTAHGAVVFVGGERVFSRSRAESFDADAGGGYAFVRDDEGRISTHPMRPPSTLPTSVRPEYDGLDDRCVRGSLQNGVLAVPVDDGLAFLDLRLPRPGRTPADRRAPSPHGGDVSDAAWNGDRLLVHGARGARVIDWSAGAPSSRATLGPATWAGSSLCDVEASAARNRKAEFGYLFGARRAPVAALRAKGAGLRILFGSKFAQFVDVADAASPWDGLALSDDGTRLARMGRDGAGKAFIECLDAARGERIWRTDVGDARDSNEIRFSPDGAFVGAVVGGFVLGGPSEGIVYFDREGRVVGTDPGGPANVRPTSHTGAFAFSADGRYAVSASFRRQVVVRDLRRGVRALEFEVPQDAYSHFAQVRAAPGGDVFVLSYPERRLLYVASYERGLLPGGRLETAPAWSDGAFDFVGDDALAVVEPDGVAIRSLRDFERLALLPGIADGVRASEDGRRIAVVRKAEVRVYGPADESRPNGGR